MSAASGPEATPAAPGVPPVEARPTVLVVEDEAHLAAGLKLNLELEGYRVVSARTIREAASLLLQVAPIDLVLLDIMLPDGDGYGFCKQLRESGHFIPVIMLTARGAAEERVRGLDSGADDYLAKPFALPELLARVRSALRRRDWEQRGAGPDLVRGKLAFGSVTIDFDSHEVLVSGRPIRLTQLELDLVYYFAQNARRVLSRDELLEHVWKLHNAPNTRSVDNFIVRLRKYFEPHPEKPAHFLSHRGSGYKFVPDGHTGN
jgi:two-component system OmpR family response regulator